VSVRVTTRQIMRDRATEVLEVGPDEAANGDWRWLLERMAEDNLSLIARVEELERITGTSFRECVRTLMSSRGIKRQKELVGRIRKAGSPITENTLSDYLRRRHAAPRRFFRDLEMVLELTWDEKTRVAWTYVWED
jgi:hypothetical protein